MKQVLLMIALVALVGCGTTSWVSDPDNVIIEKEIRAHLEKPTGELTKADLDKVPSLSLTYTTITDEGLKEVVKLQNLTILYLSDTKITDAGLKDVAKLQQLKYLYLNGSSKITNAAVKELTKLKNLTELYLFNTKITAAGVAELQKALPKCEIWH